MKPLLETIDTRFGTTNKHAFSRGNTLPYTGVPFGMNYFVPQTSDQDGSWFFDPHLPIFQGIRLTHQAPSDTCHQSTGWRQPLSPPIFL